MRNHVERPMNQHLTSKQLQSVFQRVKHSQPDASIDDVNRLFVKYFYGTRYWHWACNAKPEHVAQEIILTMN